MSSGASFSCDGKNARGILEIKEPKPFCKTQFATCPLVSSFIFSLVVLLAGLFNCYLQNKAYWIQEKNLERHYLDIEKQLLPFAVSNAVGYIRHRQSNVEGLVLDPLRFNGGKI